MINALFLTHLLKSSLGTNGCFRIVHMDSGRTKTITESTLSGSLVNWATKSSKIGIKVSKLLKDFILTHFKLD
jgi:hypothetical protein